MERGENPGCVLALGVGLVVLGGLVGLLGLLAAVGLYLAGDQLGAVGRQPGAIASVLGMYGLAAAALLTCGIGVLLFKRWGRVLTVGSAWLVLVAGVASLPGTLGILSRSGDIPAGGYLSVWFVVFVLLPGVALLVLAGAPAVRAFELRDPQPSPLDEVPLPLVAAGVGSALGGAYLLLMAPVLQGAALFGAALPLPLARLAWILLGGTSVAVGLGLLRLRAWAWWLCLAQIAFMAAALVGNALRMSPEDFYRAYGYSEEMVRQLRSLHGANVVVQGQWFGLVGCAVYAALLAVYRRRF